MTTHPFAVSRHSLSHADRAAAAAIHAHAAPGKGKVGGPESRAMFDELMAHTPAAAGVAFEAATVGGVPGWWCRPSGAKGPAAQSPVIYFHGGAYVIGSAQAYRHLGSQIAARTGAAVFVADYALAPERPFPRAFEDALAVCDALPGAALVGDSAGGGLALAALAARRTTLKGAAVLSPWVDLACESESFTTRAEADPYFVRERLLASARLYLGAHDAKDPRASPLFGDLAGLPPVRIDVGDDEVLRDDSVRYGERLAAAGGDVAVHLWTGLPHVFPSNLGTFEAAELALVDIAAFLRGLI